MVNSAGRSFYLALILFFVSGVSGLIYQVLWLKELGLLFGNSSQAMAATLAAFFSGLAVGGYHWGYKVSGQQRALRTYAWLELGIAVSAFGYFLLLQAYALIYPTLFAWFGNERQLFILVKFLLAMVVLFPPAYCMGGTLPVLSHYIVRQHQQLDQKVSVLYVVNMLGSILGVILASFYLW